MKKGGTSNTAKLYIFKFLSIKGILTILIILNTLTSLHNHFIVAGTPTPTLQSTPFSGEIAENFSAHPRVSDQPPKIVNRCFFEMPLYAIIYIYTHKNNHHWFKMIFFQNFITTCHVFRVITETPWVLSLKTCTTLPENTKTSGFCTSTKWHLKDDLFNSGPTGFLSNQNNHHNYTLED